MRRLHVLLRFCSPPSPWVRGFKVGDRAELAPRALKQAPHLSPEERNVCLERKSVFAQFYYQCRRAVLLAEMRSEISNPVPLIQALQKGPKFGTWSQMGPKFQFGPKKVPILLTSPKFLSLPADAAEKRRHTAVGSLLCPI